MLPDIIISIKNPDKGTRSFSIAVTYLNEIEPTKFERYKNDKTTVLHLNFELLKNKPYILGKDIADLLNSEENTKNKCWLQNSKLEDSKKDFFDYLVKISNQIRIQHNNFSNKRDFIDCPLHPNDMFFSDCKYCQFNIKTNYINQKPEIVNCLGDLCVTSIGEIMDKSVTKDERKERYKDKSSHINKNLLWKI